ncbi:aspartate aminotransferase family protein [Shewanella surugensis]|uniref:Aspartate aminotransferase family protein n=1 Tax=Shewanella surugensis TaxID=212020 RepID=A0ABT0LA08_9GAMM|nr:aspartate aminotransferase family protein [Shewanella surugensis]MCL1124514.1 aspartate aminotransferase family protein [Shewanella surugensis]
MDLNRSAQLFERAQAVLPGGVSRNTIFKSPHPTYVSHGKGCYVTDINGVKRIDFANNMASLIHGHAQPNVTQAIIEQVQKGTAFTLATELEIEFAELLCQRVPSFEKIRFVNSGTEAVMAMIKTARAFTQKSKIAKVEGAYHGSYDYAEVSQTASPATWGDEHQPHSVAVARGTPDNALNDVIVIPYNDVDKALHILNQHKETLAGILIDPISHRVGMIPATPEFIDALYQWSRDNQALLLFDEVITFRTSLAGAQAKYNVKPDLTAIGKMIGGGFPVGAFAGRSDVMQVLDPSQSPLLLPHSGTFSANPVTMVAGLTAMRLFDQPTVDKLNQLGDFARVQLTDTIKKVGIKACVTGAGSMFRLHFKAQAPQHYRHAYTNTLQTQATKYLLNYLFDNGIMMINTGSAMLSTPMGKKEINYLVEQVTSGLTLVKDQFPALKV